MTVGRSPSHNRVPPALPQPIRQQSPPHATTSDFSSSLGLHMLAMCASFALKLDTEGEAPYLTFAELPASEAFPYSLRPLRPVALCQASCGLERDHPASLKPETTSFAVTPYPDIRYTCDYQCRTRPWPFLDLYSAYLLRSWHKTSSSRTTTGGPPRRLGRSTSPCQVLDIMCAHVLAYDTPIDGGHTRSSCRALHSINPGKAHLRRHLSR